MLCMRGFLIGLACLLAGCAPDESAFGPDDEAFVGTMVELRRAAMIAGTDTARFDELRSEILRERSVTEDDLRAYVEARAANLDHMAAVWDSVGARLSELPPQ